MIKVLAIKTDRFTLRRFSTIELTDSLSSHTASSQEHSQGQQIHRDLTGSHENKKNSAIAHNPQSSTCHIDEFSILYHTWNIWL